MTIDDEMLEKLEKNLDELTGYDFEEVERLEHKNGNYAPEIGMTKSFQARLAARALNIPYPELQILKMREYNKLTVVVFNFLYNGLGKKEVRQENSKA